MAKKSKSGGCAAALTPKRSAWESDGSMNKTDRKTPGSAKQKSARIRLVSKG